MSRLHDPSTELIKRALITPKQRFPVTSHAGVASVATDGGEKPTQHKSDCGPNTATNAAFNEATKPTRETTRPDQLVAAGITGNYGR